MNWVLFLSILVTVESHNDSLVIGDKNLTNRAYGICQIRQGYLDDVNKIAHTHYTMEDLIHNKGLSRWCVVQYVSHYGIRYTRLTNRPVTIQVAARIHNGGPNGWRRKSTDAFLEKFKNHLSDRKLNLILDIR